MNTKRVCERLSISPKALRIYEENNIVVPLRNNNGYRNYREEDLIKLREVILLKELGFSLKEIKVLADKNKYENFEIIRSLYFQEKAIENKITELENIKSTLSENIQALLNSKETYDYELLFTKIDKSLDYNKLHRNSWIDRWSFDFWAANYDTSVHSNEKDELGLFEQYDNILEKVRNLILEHSPKKILDIGCGTGNLCGSLSRTLEVTGIDQSIEMLLAAKIKYPDMKLRTGNFLDKPFCSEEFDVVVSTYAFHHLKTEEKKQAIKNMLQYLHKDTTNKINGEIIIADLMFLNHNTRMECKEKFLKLERNDLWEEIEDEYYTNIEELQDYVESLGYTMTYEHAANFTWIVRIN